ncbi:MAG: glycosyl hydrolase [Bacteroidetes bacterium]|nr:glycosyl hydrolase [Bacteroidota bacterium]MBS1539092.1 glycosyl hydrolase [Bacteroidota bacterium]
MPRFSFLVLALLIGTSAFSQNLDSVFKYVKYRSIGPFRGGRSVCASGVVNEPTTYYMGTTGGGLWKTEDAGVSWKNISDGFFKTGSVGAIAVSESDPNIVYVGMGEHAPRGVMTSYGDGVYKSYDAGKTWKKIGLEKTLHISRIVIHPKNPDVVLVAAQGAIHGPTPDRGIYKSTNGGLTWTRVLFVNELTGCAELSMDMSNPKVLYAAMWHHQRLPWKVISGGDGSGLYKSTDGGDTWEKMQTGLPKEMGKMAIAVSRANPEKVYAVIESDTQKETGGLFVSNDAGKTWSRVSDNHELVQRAWYYIEVFPDPQDENVVYVLSSPALRSIDGGKTWEHVEGWHGDTHDLWINPHNNKNMVLADDGGASISFNKGKTWSLISNNMPTGQFYRINADNLFPYHIYGGQQDNTSVRIKNLSPGSGGISERDWNSSAGSESAFLAFNPDDPKLVLGGSYLGTIDVYYPDAHAGTNIMAAPIQYLGRASKDMKYRFNWNAPIIWSKHEPNTFYHGAQLLLRTRNNGMTWEEASPDLTRNEKDKQGKGGGPYTVEAVGAENYGTLSYVIESPTEKGVIWTGSDDGLVQLTRDGGKTWSNVTPKNLPECLINSIELSPHDPATAYLATTRYKFNDFSPALYKTTDYGKTWTNISNGIPAGAYTRVVREDEVRKNLLFAGTETGLYVSWNGGASWQPFQLNLPITPISDLKVHKGDLIVATMGRAYWILDDLSLIRQYNGANETVKVFQPKDAVIGNWSSPLNSTSSDFKGSDTFQGINPANGVVIYYNLPKIPDSLHISLEIHDGMGKLIRSFSSKKDESFKSYPGGPSAEPLLTKTKGINRFVWNMRYPTMTGVPEVYIESNFHGHKASPGSYSITLKYGKAESKTDCKILPSPLYNVSPEAYADYNTFMATAEENLNDMHKKVNRILKMRQQLETVLKEFPEGDTYKTLKKQGDELVKKMKAWDDDMVQRKAKAYDDADNYENKFTANFLFLINHAEGDIPKVTQPSRDRYQELLLEWNKLNTRALEITDKDIPAYTKQLWDAGIGAVSVPQK